MCEKGRFCVLFRRKFIPILHIKSAFLEDTEIFLCFF